MIDEPGAPAPYRMAKSAAISTFVPLGGVWMPYQGDGNAQVPVVRHGIPERQAARAMVATGLPDLPFGVF